MFQHSSQTNHLFWISYISSRNKSCLSKCLKQNFPAQLFAQKGISISLLIFGICQFSLSFLYHMHNVFRHLSLPFAGRMKSLSQEFCECYHHKIKFLFKNCCCYDRPTFFCSEEHFVLQEVSYTFQLPLVHEVFTFVSSL